MSLDARKNFAISTVDTAPSPATSGTSLNVPAAAGTKFPAAPFNAVVWPTGANPTSANAEIIRVTSKGTGDNWTIQRAQEGSTARSIIAGDQIMQSPTDKTFKDIEDYLTGVSSPTLKQPTINSPATFDGGEALYKQTVYFQGSGTYSKPAGLKFIVVEVVGGGGAGGGAAATASGQVSVGSGGGAGGYSMEKILASALASSETVTVGGGGVGSTSGNPAASGTTTSFGSFLQATGGDGGWGITVLSAGQSWEGGPGGVGSGGDLNTAGGQGFYGCSTSGGRGFSGPGGTSRIGGGGKGSNGTGTTQSIQGGDAATPGAGGGGSCNANSQSAVRGGHGAPGIVMIHEYF